MPAFSAIEKNKNLTIFVGLLFRVWFGYTMMDNGKFIFDKTNEEFFLDWFGNKLHFPAPLLLYYLAKGSEFFGGLFLSIGLFTRIAGFFIAFTMLVATLTANIHDIYLGDGAITISFFLFALLFVGSGGGQWSLDRLIFHRRNRYSYRKPEKLCRVFSLIIRVWFASMLFFIAAKNNGNDPLYVLFKNLHGAATFLYTIKVIEVLGGLSLITGLFSKMSAMVVGLLMLVTIVCSKVHLYDFGNASIYANIFCWFCALLFFNLPGCLQFPLLKKNTQAPLAPGSHDR